MKIEHVLLMLAAVLMTSCDVYKGQVKHDDQHHDKSGKNQESNESSGGEY